MHFSIDLLCILQVLHPPGVPLYFTVHVSNEAGVSVPATCRLDTFDITIPGGRMAEAFISTSNPNVLKGVVTVYEDSPLQQTMVAVGYGKGIWGEQVVRWNATTVAANTVNYDVGQWCSSLTEDDSLRFMASFVFMAFIIPSFNYFKNS